MARARKSRRTNIFEINQFELKEQIAFIKLKHQSLFLSFFLCRMFIVSHYFSLKYFLTIILPCLLLPYPTYIL